MAERRSELVTRRQTEEARLAPAKLDTRFELVSDFEPRGDQPRAIADLVAGLEAGEKHQVLLGVSGSGKTYTIASMLQRVNRPALVLAHNKILAAQLYQEFKAFFPKNAVEYFVSYYDYYQPEAYVPASDTYIDKEATINDEIDRLRLSATRSLFERRRSRVRRVRVARLWRTHPRLARHRSGARTTYRQVLCPSTRGAMPVRRRPQRY